MNTIDKNTGTEKTSFTRRLYGRRFGRPLNPSRIKALDDKLETLSVLPKRLTEDGTLAPTSLFDIPQPETWLEIGFGTGEHLNALIEQFPDVNFLGAEPFINGMSAFLKNLDTAHEPRTRVLMDDALKLVLSLADNTIDRLYVLNPDPWPKKRHHKRRIISQTNLDAFARVMKTGAQIVMATDVDDLAEWMVTQCSNHPAFIWTAKNQADWKTPPPEWIETRFAFKGKQAGRHQTFLIFERT